MYRLVDDVCKEWKTKTSLVKTLSRHLLSDNRCTGIGLLPGSAALFMAPCGLAFGQLTASINLLKACSNWILIRGTIRDSYTATNENDKGKSLEQRQSTVSTYN
jgi:hypothetical protein